MSTREGIAWGLVAALTVILGMVLFSGQKAGERMDRLEEENRTLRVSVDSAMAINKVLKEEITVHISMVDSLDNLLVESEKRMKDEIKRISDLDRVFRELPESGRDSIIRAYIRNNQ